MYFLRCILYVGVDEINYAKLTEEVYAVKDIYFGLVARLHEPQEIYSEGASYRRSSEAAALEYSLQRLREHLSQYVDFDPRKAAARNDSKGANANKDSLEADLDLFFK